MPDPVADYETAASGFAGVLAQCGDDLSDAVAVRGLDGAGRRRPRDGRHRRTTRRRGAGRCPTCPTTPTAPPATPRSTAPSPTTCRQPGVLEQMVPSPLGGGEMPAAMMFGILTSDTLIHTWDLARADRRRRAARPGPAPAHVGRADPDGGDGAPPRGVRARPSTIDDGAPMQDRAMAWFGRQP